MGETGQRLFFALWPDEPVRQAIAAAGRQLVQRERLRGRLVPVQHIHLTLLFLGDVPAPLVEPLRDAASGVRSPAFDLVLNRAGSFRRSKVLWLGPEAVPEALTGLWLQLRDRVQAAGVPHDRLNLSPHVTCLRDADRSLPPAPVEPIAWAVREFVLVHSVLGPHPAPVIDKDHRPGALAPGASQYHVVSHWPL